MKNNIFDLAIALLLGLLISLVIGIILNENRSPIKIHMRDVHRWENPYCEGGWVRTKLFNDGREQIICNLSRRWGRWK